MASASARDWGSTSSEVAVTVASMLKAAIKAGVFFTGFLASDRVIRSRIESRHT